MKNTIRCCISCILPCGALDVIRIVHANGRVEELTGTVKAEEIMKLHPKHVLKKPSSAPSEQGMRPKIAVVPPDAELKRGRIYFLMPLPPPLPEKNRKRSAVAPPKRRKKELSEGDKKCTAAKIVTSENSLISDRYLTEIMSEKIATQRDRRRGRAGVWRPHLQSISEIPLIED
ncbi:hypothetical protein CASFOL_031512 [Castilleja foliolosa]|uniref:Uncharacterized protein n=1 Tax=Castilleja foliolosa TaxID=1961234 RepID=A0ABD3C5W6_9LAMI